jgi:5-methyltetrahydrofolate--homocysteine methyltransferase
MNKINFFDGGMGTMLQANGLKAGELPEKLNITNPELVYSIHKAYADAGADYISTNTFGANGLKFDNVDEIIKAAVALAKRTGKKVALDLGPLGKLLKPMGDLSFEEAYELYKEMILAGKDSADVVFFETMNDSLEIKAAVLAAKENCELPIFVSMMFDESSRLLTGADIISTVTMLEGLGVNVIGTNCGLGPEQMYPIVEKMRRVSSLPILVNPNAGLPESINGKTKFNVEPDEFADWMQKIAKLGVSYLGGCCGTTPEHIVKLVQACKQIESFIPECETRTLVSSYSKTVEIGKEPVIIGERINPTGKKLFKEALRQNDINYIVKEGLAQKDKGAHILDVNVGLPEINEPVMMKEAVFALQSVLDLPLQIDTSNTSAMDAALRIYNGKAMLNSVNGKKSSMDAVFPIAKKYGAVVVCLCLDESGIPDTCEGRIRVAEKIIETAAKYGIEKKDLVFDALTLTISTNSQNSNETLKTVQYLHDKLGVSTVLGVSNISFGLPSRVAINTAFFNMALNSGLSAAIINPLSEPMMNTYYAFMALKGYDLNCEKYIASVVENKEPPKMSNNSDLKTAIIKGMKDEAADCARILVKSDDSLKIINEYIIPALDYVGDGFEKKTMFLPQLLMSADSAKAAFEVLKEKMIRSGVKQSSEGKIVLATVHGDIHDIGKNIVKVLLENYGFDVIDLGKDVPEETVLGAVKESGATLVGLSALMTTTVPAMERTIKLVHSETNAKVAVGGAVLTKNYADMIDADFYGRDAMEMVRIAKQHYKK